MKKIYIEHAELERLIKWAQEAGDVKTVQELIKYRGQ